MTETMLEKAARAMFAADNEISGLETEWALEVHAHETYRALARASFQAARRPDANACEAAERATGISNVLANHVFTAMIDAILSEAGE